MSDKLPTDHQLSAHFKEWTKNEIKFLDGEANGERNEHGAFCYQSQSGNHLIALDLFLASYRMWLIDNKIVKEIE